MGVTPEETQHELRSLCGKNIFSCMGGTLNFFFFLSKHNWHKCCINTSIFLRPNQYWQLMINIWYSLNAGWDTSVSFSKPIMIIRNKYLVQKHNAALILSLLHRHNHPLCHCKSKGSRYMRFHPSILPRLVAEF